MMSGVDQRGSRQAAWDAASRDQRVIMGWRSGGYDCLADARASGKEAPMPRRYRDDAILPATLRYPSDMTDAEWLLN